MKRVAIVGIGLLLLVANSSTVKSSELAPFALEIQAAKSSVEIGNPVLLSVTTKNIAGATIRISQTNPGIEYDFDVQDANGRAVTEKPLLQQLKHTQYLLRNVSVVLKPEQSVSERFAVSDLFEFVKQGPYSIQVRRPIPDYFGHAVVKSNTITIVITTAP